MYKKAQISVDFMVAITIALILFLIILKSAHSQKNEADHVIQNLDAKHIAEKIASGINDIYLSGNGAYRNMTLPKKLHGGKIYTLRVYPRSVLINYSSETGENYHSHRILTRDIEGCENGLELTPGKVLIANSNGTIQLTAVP